MIHLKREIKEETNISDKFIKNITILGITISARGNAPILCDVNLSIDSKRVKELFKKRKDNEISKLILVNKNNLNKMLKKMGGFYELLIELMK